MKYLCVLNSIYMTGSVSLMAFTSSVVIVAAICLICCHPTDGITLHSSGTPSLVQARAALATHTTRRLSKSVEPKIPQCPQHC